MDVTATAMTHWLSAAQTLPQQVALVLCWILTRRKNLQQTPHTHKICAIIAIGTTNLKLFHCYVENDSLKLWHRQKVHYCMASLNTDNSSHLLLSPPQRTTWKM